MTGRRAAPGRRAAGPDRRRVGLGTLLMVALPVVAVLAALLVRPAGDVVRSGAPSTTPLTSATLACPGAEGAADLAVASLAGPGASGALTADGAPVPLAPGTVAAVPGAAAFLQATDGLAVGLLATRSVARPLAAVACAPTASEQWFTGVGAAAEHSSVLELVNPDQAPAVADVSVYSATGATDVPALRGIAVAAGTTTRLDLSQVVPRRGGLSLQVQVSRGRLGVSVLDRNDELAGGTLSTDWIPAQAAPATSNLLLGLTRGTGSRTLALANPGDDEVGVDLQLVSKRATFVPEGIEAVRVPPRSSLELSLDTLLADASRRGAIGLLVGSTGPVTASLRQVTGSPAADLSVLAPDPLISSPTGLALPTTAGRSRLLLGGVSSAGTVTVRATDAAGAELSTTQVELAPDTAANLALPQGTALVTLDPGTLTLRGAVLVQKPGATVLPLRDLSRTTRVPSVRPGLS